MRLHFPLKILLSTLILSSICLAGSPLSPVDSAGNVVTNFSFEEGGSGWNIWGGGVSDVARSGRAGLTIRNEEPKWSGAEQMIVLPDGAAHVTVSGWIKTDDVVQGRENWEMARISVEFRDERGNLIGGYPPPVGQIAGTTDWTHYTNTYRVSTAARTVTLQCALGNATGAAHFDDITITIRNRAGELLEAGRLSGIMDEGEWYALPVRQASRGGHYVDWSRLLDAPAGKHGFLQVRDGRLVFENGTPARFWGTNLVANDNFAADSLIDSLVTRLAKMGVNMLRLHHLDAPWTAPNIFGNTPGTRELSKESMRQLDYLIYRCKQKGIYIFLDLLVHRDFTEADGIENRPPDLGGKQIGFFYEKIIELQKEFNENLLNHVNQFTGVAYKDEPAIALSAFINESTIFGAFSSDILTPYYRQVLNDIWSRRDRPRQGMQNNDCGCGGYAQIDMTIDGNDIDTENENDIVAVDDEDDIDTDGGRYINADNERDIAGDDGVGTLAVFSLDWQNDRPRLRLASAEGDIEESIQFLSELEAGYFKRMEEHLRGVGVRYPLAGSNMPLPLLATLRNNTALDIIIQNDYWDHPQVWKIDNDWDNILTAPFHNRSQLRNPGASAIQNKSYYRVDGMPFLITEWNHCYPNEHVLEGVPLMAAYGALQGWDGILQFDANHHVLGKDRIRSYTLSVQPEDVALWVMAAPLFLRGDVQAAPGLVIEGISEEQYGNIPSYSDMLERNYHLPFITRVAKRFDAPSSGSIEHYARYYSREDGVTRSETGELAINSKVGYMRIETPRIQGANGFIGGVELNFPLFSTSISNSHAAIYAVSADGEDLISSKRFYLVVTGPAKMRGQVYDPVRNLLESAGEGEVLTQVVDGMVVFNQLGGKKLQIFPLEMNGRRGKKMSLRRVRGSSHRALDLSRGRTLVYEVVLK
ncbi:MAG: carbohydrate binding domain-containing protein [Chitinispirillales bacterium]|nr:carbohydrate binding domain-containing protein [Chitinispirillales bacterium]